MSEDSLLDGSPRPAEERHLSQNSLTAYGSASHPSLDHKNPRDGDLGRRQRWLPIASRLTFRLSCGVASVYDAGVPPPCDRSSRAAKHCLAAVTSRRFISRDALALAPARLRVVGIGAQVSLDGRWKRYLGEPPRNLMSSIVSSSSLPPRSSGSCQLLLSDMKGQACALPFLEHALFKLWESRDGRRLTAKSYIDMGRLGGALDAHAEEFFTTMLTLDVINRAQRVVQLRRIIGFGIRFVARSNERPQVGGTSLTSKTGESLPAGRNRPIGPQMPGGMTTFAETDRRPQRSRDGCSRRSRGASKLRFRPLLHRVEDSLAEQRMASLGR